MGCHTWFGKPIKQDTRSLEEKRKYLLSIYQQALNSSLYSNHKNVKKYYRRVVKLIPKFSEQTINNMIWLENESFQDYYYKDVEDFHDVFRVYNYPNDILASIEEVKEFLHKRGQKLSTNQEERLISFFEKYPKGIIYFG